MKKQTSPGKPIGWRLQLGINDERLQGHCQASMAATSRR
jgi:hypothetical protein